MIARHEALERLRRGGAFDLAIVGGGVTGAAVLYEASRRGLRAALVERGDFASGTSSRSSKLVHGGLRYLREGKLGLTRESVRERQALLRDLPGLVEPVEFVMPHYRGRKPSRTTLALGLALYDLLARSWRHRYLDRQATLALVPPLDERGLTGAHAYLDATTGDARLVLRLLQEACALGAIAVNYAEAAPLIAAGSVRGVRVRSSGNPDGFDVAARAVINATGAYADGLRAALGAPPRLRPLRGSHLVLDPARLPLTRCVAFEHPADGRPVFAYPWLGRILVGTTDLDHGESLVREPAISPREAEYLREALSFAFPNLDAVPGVVATFAGVRPIVDTTAAPPSKASRDHVVWKDSGLITITGGKLTTFRPMAMDALRAAAPALPPFDLQARRAFSNSAIPRVAGVDPETWRRLTGRFGSACADVVARAAADDLQTIGNTPFTWAELRWSARHESVLHLDDLLLRRTRAGLLLRDGASEHFDRIAATCAQELGWDSARWARERAAYLARVHANYGVPA
ncbi:MAG TPA: glycerol-3-phosphate dehydrogenase/oxidase [Candidatus Acidoferrales bacterium]|nr:glycerol-3-phosphate dehydrogenase/oxidase [Candidatus Acidoferrales bacterium]